MRYPLLIPPPASRREWGRNYHPPLDPLINGEVKQVPLRLVGGVGGGEQKRDRIFRASSRNDPPAEKLHQRHDN